MRLFVFSVDGSIIGAEDHKKKKKSRKSKGLDDTQDEIDASIKIANGNGTLLADVQHAKQFTLASSTVPAKMQASEWPLLLKVHRIYL